MPENKIQHQQTNPVRKGEELQERNLKQFLQQNDLINAVESELKVSQFSNGYSNLTYLLLIEENEFVLRRPPFAAPKRGHNMGREYKVLSNLHKVFDKAPKTYAYSENLDILGAPFYLMNKVEGIILTSKIAHKSSIAPSEWTTIGSTWLDAFVELHQVDHKSVGLEDLGRPEGYVARQVENWGKQYLVAATDEVPSAHKVMSWMNEHQPKKYDHSLIHNDFKYDNVVFKNEQWNKVSAVLDWEMCTLGDPLMDLGTSLGYWIAASDESNPFLSPTALPGNLTRLEIVEQYAVKSGTQINNLVFYYTFGLFKIAVIAQQIYYRYKHGHTTDQRFASLNKVAESCINSAWRAIQNKQID